MSALVIGGRPLHDAMDLVRRYCGLPWSGGADETWAYRYFDAVDVERSDRVEPVDVLAAAALHPGLRHADLTWFWQHRDDLVRLLKDLPPAVDLADADGRVVAAVQALPRQLSEAAPGLSLLTKVLHRKRPRLVPMLDRALLDRYRARLPGRGTESWARLVEALRDDLTVPANARILSELADSLSGDLRAVPTHLRLVDIAVWMQARTRIEG